MTAFQSFKTLLVDHTHLAKDALHIYVALGVFFGSCLLFGWKARHWRPWLLVLVAALLGEAWDLAEASDSNDPVDKAGHIKDVWNTLLVPTVLMVLARFSTVFADPIASGDEAEVADPATDTERDIGDPGH